MADASLVPQSENNVASQDYLSLPGLPTVETGIFTPNIELSISIKLYDLVSI